MQTIGIMGILMLATPTQLPVDILSTSSMLSISLGFFVIKTDQSAKVQSPVVHHGWDGDHMMLQQLRQGAAIDQVDAGNRLCKKLLPTKRKATPGGNFATTHERWCF